MTPQSHQSTTQKHEPRDVDVVGIGLVIILVVLIGALGLLSAWGLLRLVQNGRDDRKIQRGTIAKLDTFPQPRLEVNPVAALQATDGKSEARLNSYGWIDRKAGVVHLPIKRAMQLTLERGLPEVGGGQTRLQMMQARPVENIQPNEQSTPASPSP